MQLLQQFLDLILHLDKHLNLIISDWGAWTYLILFAIIFCETGLVVTPILPGDSLLFAAGTFAASGSLDLSVLIVLLSAAAILGDTVNYACGLIIGPKVFRYEKSRFFKREYLQRTHEFYERHGGKTIIIARFIPIIRTFAPFVAGVARMSYARFVTYNIVGGIVWIVLFTGGGYLFGNLPIVRDNFTLVMLAIVFVSVMPPVIEHMRARARARKGEMPA
jgi:membrane-associated protein